jgi:hypothetical protein
MDMPNPRCPYCRELFDPSRYHPDQIVCSNGECQLKRRTDYHRRKLQNDSTYREQCCDSQEKWRNQHPDYMHNYRKKHGRLSTKKTPTTREFSRRLNRILARVKNNVGLDLTSYGKSVCVLVISSDEHVKNILATADLILIEGLQKED